MEHTHTHYCSCRGSGVRPAGGTLGWSLDVTALAVGLFAFRECLSLLSLHVLSCDDDHDHDGGGGRGGGGPDRAGPGSKSSPCEGNLNCSPFDLVNLGTRVSGKG